MDLVGDIVVLQQAGQDSTCAEGVGFEGDEDENGRGQRVSRVLEVGV